jgi:dihydrodipicolinate synthase/N-acetylneuraminate lyase
VNTKPWHGVLVANPLALKDDLSIDFDRYAEHIRWLAASGCDGVTPNGSLGEYQTLSDEERARVMQTAVEAAPEGFEVIPAVSATDRAKRFAGPSWPPSSGRPACWRCRPTPTGPTSAPSSSTTAPSPP